jgi:hypothetical protein
MDRGLKQAYKLRYKMLQADIAEGQLKGKSK